MNVRLEALIAVTLVLVGWAIFLRWPHPGPPTTLVDGSVLRVAMTFLELFLWLGIISTALAGLALTWCLVSDSEEPVRYRIACLARISVSVPLAYLPIAGRQR